MPESVDFSSFLNHHHFYVSVQNRIGGKMKFFAKLVAITLVVAGLHPTPVSAAGSNIGTTDYIPCKFGLIAAKGTTAVIAYASSQSTTDPDTLDVTISDVIKVKVVSSRGTISSTKTLTLSTTERIANTDGCMSVVATSGYFYIAIGLINEVQDDPACVPDPTSDPAIECSVTVTDYLQFWRSANGITWARVGRLSGLGTSEFRVTATTSTVLVVAGIPTTDPDCIPGSIDSNGYTVECDPDRFILKVYESSSSSITFSGATIIATDAEMSDGYMSAEFSGGSFGILSWRNVNGEYVSSTRKGTGSWYRAATISLQTSGYTGSSTSAGKTAIIAWVDSDSTKLSWRMSTNSGKTWAATKRSASLVAGDIWTRNAWVLGSKFYIAVDRGPWDGAFYSSVYQISTSAVRKFTTGAYESITGGVALGSRIVLVARYQIGSTYYLRLYSFV
jgi:hypothetical protein